MSVLSSEEIETFRRDTAGCAQVNHLNNAGAALPPAPVTEAVISHLRLEEATGGYEAAAEAADLVDNTYTAVARLIGCEPREVAIVENATRAWDMAFYGLRLSRGDKILTSRAEYASNVIAFLQRAAHTGVEVELVDDDEHGQLDVADLERRIDERTRLVAVTHVPTQGGLVNPAAEIGAIAHDHGVPFLLDACQSTGQLDLDVAELQCDFLSATGRKYLRGPRGTGFLYVASDWIDRLEPPFLDLHAATWTSPNSYRIRDDARRFENWETNYAAKIGLGVAVDYALAIGLDRIETTVVGLADRLRSELGGIRGVTVHDQGRRQCGIVTFSVDGHSAHEVKEHLGSARINTSVTASASSRNDLAARGLDDLVRASVHYYNTEDETSALCESVTALRDR